jgi:hypothetical protein
MQWINVVKYTKKYGTFLENLYLQFLTETSVMNDPNWLEIESKKKSNNGSINKTSIRNVATEWIVLHVPSLGPESRYPDRGFWRCSLLCQGTAEIARKVRLRSFSSTSFPLHNCLSVLQFDAIYSELGTEGVVK